MVVGGLAQPAMLGDAAATGLKRAVSISGVRTAGAEKCPTASGARFSRARHEGGLGTCVVVGIAAVALPGVGGLLIVCAAGMRLDTARPKPAWQRTRRRTPASPARECSALLAPAPWSRCGREQRMSLFGPPSARRPTRLLKSRQRSVTPRMNDFHIRAGVRTLSSQVRVMI